MNAHTRRLKKPSRTEPLSVLLLPHPGAATVLRRSVVYTLVSSQIGPARPCSARKKKRVRGGLSCKGSDRPRRVRGKSISPTRPPHSLQKVSLQQFVSSVTNGRGRPLAAGFNNDSDICIQLNLSVLISSVGRPFFSSLFFFFLELKCLSSQAVMRKSFHQRGGWVDGRGGGGTS